MPILARSFAPSSAASAGRRGFATALLAGLVWISLTLPIEPGAAWAQAVPGAAAPAPGALSVSIDALRLRCRAPDRWGSAVLIQDFRAGHEDRLLLLTALHVLQGCASLQLWWAACPAGQVVQDVLLAPWSWRRPIDILAWKTLDLAAIPIASPDHEVLREAIRQGRYEVYRSSDGSAPLSQRLERNRQRDAALPPAEHVDLELWARGGTGLCPPTELYPRALFDGRTLYEAIIEERYQPWQEVLGDIAVDTPMLAYVPDQSVAKKGMSGGPVLWPRWNRRAVLAIHVGGEDPAPMKWGVLLQVNRLRQTPPIQARLDSEQPQLTIPGYEPPGLDEIGRGLMELDRQLHSTSLAMSAEVGTSLNLPGSTSVSPQVAWSERWMSLGLGAISAALGSRVAVGGTFGTYRSPMTGPNFEERASSGSARLPFTGGWAELDAELHLARLLPVDYVASVGLRAGVSHQRHVTSEPFAFVWGPVVSGRARLRWTDQLRSSLQLGFMVQQTPVAACPPGCEGSAERRPAIWDPWLTLALGVELEP